MSETTMPALPAAAPMLRKRHTRGGLPTPPQEVTTELYVPRTMRMSLLSSTEVRRLSVLGPLGATNLSTYNTNTSLPQADGVMDTLMGAEGDVLCKTCLNTARNGMCLGHAGHMELAVPVLHPQFIKTINKLLNCVCFACGATLLSDVHRAVLKTITTLDRRIAYAADKSSRRARCGSCSLPTQPEFEEREKLFIKISSWDKQRFVAGTDDEEAAFWAERVKAFDNHTILDILHMAMESEEHCRDPRGLRTMLGLPPTLKPDSLVVTALRLNCKTTRPTRVIGGRRIPHDLTRRLLFIMGPNENLKRLKALREQWEAKTLPDVKVREALRDKSSKTIPQLLAWHEEFNGLDVPTQIMNLFNSQAVLPMQRKKRHGEHRDTRGSIKDFLGGKMGLVRRQTRGGRVLHSARATLSPAPRAWPLDTVGMPEWMAVRLTRPVRVTAFNKAVLAAAVVVGYRARGGANLVVSPHGEGANLQHLTREERLQLADALEPGWTVRRVLRDGDWVIVNRPPTLHCMNFMALRVRVTRGEYTLRMCHLLAACYNFDFDGDALIVHVPQDLRAIAELPSLMGASNFVISPTDGKPVIVPQLNTPLATYLLTSAACRLGAEQTMCCLQACAPFREVTELAGRLRPRFADAPPGTLWSGRAVLETLLPPDFWYGPVPQAEGGTRANDGAVVVECGRLVSGQWNGKACFSRGRSVTQALERDYGRKATCTFLNCCMALGDAFLRQRGFSFGTMDFMQTPAMAADTRVLVDRLHAAMTVAERVQGTRLAREGLMADLTNTSLSRARELTEKHRRGRFDSVMEMVESGAKGAVAHVAQMRILLGQQIAGNTRVFVDDAGRRESSFFCFPRGDHSALAHGLVTSAYGTLNGEAFPDGRGGRIGVRPRDMAMHAVSGIHALGGTSCGVPRTGELQNALAGGGEFTVVRGNLPPRVVFTDRTPATGHRVDTEAPKQVQAMHQVVQFAYGGNSLSIQHTHAVQLRAALALPWPAAQAEMLRGWRAPGSAVARAWWWQYREVRTMLRGHWRDLEALGDVAPTSFPLVFSAVRERARLLQHWPRPPLGGGAAADAAAADVLLRLVRAIGRVAQGASASTTSFTGLWTFQMLPHMLDVLWHLRPWQLAHVPRPALEALAERLLGRLQLGLVEDGTAAGVSAVYALGSKSTQAELEKFHHVSEIQTGGITLLQRIKELTGAKTNLTNDPYTHLRFVRGINAAAAETWIHQQVFLQLHMVLLPHADGGAAVLHLPHDAARLDAAEAAAWERTWRLGGAAPPSAAVARVVLRLRFDHAVCDARHVGLDTLLGFVRQAVWRLAGCTRQLRGAAPPPCTGLDTEAPLVAATLPHDDTWSVLVSCLEWRPLARALHADDGLDTPLPESGAAGRTRAALNSERIVAAALGSHMFSGLVVRGFHSIGHAEVQPWTRRWVDGGDGTVHEEERLQCSIHGAVSPPLVARLAVAGVVDFAHTMWNDMQTVFALLGVEAARAMWLQEMLKLVRGEVHMTHLELLADMVFYLGAPLSIIVKPCVDQHSFMQAATFSRTTNMLAQAALCESEEQLMNSAALFVGRAATSGSNTSVVRPTKAYLAHVKATAVAALCTKWRTEAAEEAEMVEVDDCGRVEDEVVHVAALDPRTVGRAVVAAVAPVATAHGLESLQARRAWTRAVLTTIQDEEIDRVELQRQATALFGVDAAGEKVVAAASAASTTTTTTGPLFQEVVARSRAWHARGGGAVQEDEDEDVVMIPCAPSPVRDEMVAIPALARVVDEEVSIPAPPDAEEEGWAGLLPQGGAAACEHVGISNVEASVPMAQTQAIAALLPPGAKAVDFVFTGTAQPVAARVARHSGGGHGTAPPPMAEVLRRLRGTAGQMPTGSGGGGGDDAAAAVLGASAVVADEDDEALLADLKLMRGGYRLPDAVREVTRQAFTRTAGPLGPLGAMSSTAQSRVRLSRVLPSMQQPQSRLDAATADAATAARRRRQLMDEYRESMPPSWKAAYDRARLSEKRKETAGRARRRRRVMRAAQAGLQGYSQWVLRSPQRVTSSPTAME